MRRIIVQTEDFDIGAELKRLREQGAGGIASFIGVVRPTPAPPRLTALKLEHYPGMTEAALHKIAAEAEARFGLTACTIIHRVGLLHPGDNIVLTATASPHRHPALAACTYLIDYLKTAAPFWKQEIFEDGTSRWVEARTADDDAASKWKGESSFL